MKLIRGPVRCGVVAVAFLLVFAGACSAFNADDDDATPSPDSSINESSAAVDGSSDTSVEANASDASDASDGDPSDAPAEADATARCTSDMQFGAAVELADLGEVTSARLAANGNDVLVSLKGANGTQDIDEAPYPKGMLNYVHVVDSLEDDTHPAPVADPLRLFYERGPAGARAIVEATRAQFGQKFAAVATPALAIDAGVQTREPYALGDGAIMYFTMEPGTSGDRDIYRGARGPTGVWSLAVVGGVTSGLNEGYPVVSDDELEIFFARKLPGLPSVLMSATRFTKNDTFGSVLPVPEAAGKTDAGTASDDRPTWLSPDRCTLFFVSDRSGQYRAYRIARR